MASVAAVDLVQLSDGQHRRDHTLDLVFVSRGRGKVIWGLGTRPLPLGPGVLCRCPRCRGLGLCDLMGPAGFPRELGVIPEALVHDSAEALVTAWDEHLTRALDRITPVWTLSDRGSRRAPRFTARLREVGRHERCLGLLEGDKGRSWPGTGTSLR